MRRTFGIILGALMVVFLYVVAGARFVDRIYSGSWQPIFFFLPFLIFVALSVALVVLTLKKKIQGKLKKFLLLAGISPLAMIAAVFLHNLTFGLFTVIFGNDFWERTGMADESFFFVLAVVVCPAAFLIGLVGSIILLIRKKE